MKNKKIDNVIVDKMDHTIKKIPVINSQGTPEHKRDPIYTMSAHDKAELFIKKMQDEQNKNNKAKILNTKNKRRGKK